MVALWSLRFVIEFLKEPQVDTREDWVFNALNTGQVLSIPLVLIGIWLMFRKTAETKSMNIRPCDPQPIQTPLPEDRTVDDWFQQLPR